MITICVYIPFDNLEAVTNAMFAAGAGKIGEYENCCFYSKGSGQFTPINNSNPTIGSKGELNTVSEYRVEMTTNEQSYNNVIAAMKAAHPYEEPAWHAFKCLDDKL